MAQGFIEQKKRDAIPPVQHHSHELENAINNIKSELDDSDGDEVGEKIKNWIEKA